eukprot:353808-Chlamydomonas_euryale.AAC.5
MTLGKLVVICGWRRDRNMHLSSESSRPFTAEILRPCVLHLHMKLPTCFDFAILHLHMKLPTCFDFAIPSRLVGTASCCCASHTLNGAWTYLRASKASTQRRETATVLTFITWGIHGSVTVQLLAAWLFSTIAW